MRSWASSPAADPICVASSPKDINKSSKNGKFEKILKGSLDSIPSPSYSVKIQISDGKVCLRCEAVLGIVNNFLKTKSLLTSPSNVLPYYAYSLK